MAGPSGVLGGPPPSDPRQIAICASLILANPGALGTHTPHRLLETAKIKGKSWGGGQSDLRWGGSSVGGGRESLGGNEPRNGNME